MINSENTIHHDRRPNLISHKDLKGFQDVGDFERASVGGKGLNLAIMANRDIPVPEGFCVTIGSHDYYLEHGRIDPQLSEELEEVRQQLGGSVAVRSSATCEDGSEISMAGVFDTYYLTDPDASIEGAMQKVYDRARSSEVESALAQYGYDISEVKMGLVVQRLIEADKSGVMYTGVNGGDKLLEYIPGMGDLLVDGATTGSSVLVGANGNISQSKGFTSYPIASDTLSKITSIADEIEDIFRGQPQDIEFALKDGQVSILQARPLTESISNIDLRETPKETLARVKSQLIEIVEKEKEFLGTDKVILTDSNFSELLPRPKEMDAGVFAHIFTGSRGVEGAIQIGRKEMGYPLGDESVDMMRLIGGKPYFSLAKDAHTYYSGFPATRNQYTQSLVAEYLQITENDPTKAHYPEMGLYLQDPTENDLEERYGDQAPDYYDRYTQFSHNLAKQAEKFLEEYTNTRLPVERKYLDTISDVSLDKLNSEYILKYIFDALEHLRTESCVDFVKAARLGFYYSQKLQNKLRKITETEEEADSLFSSLSQGLAGSEITQANLDIASATNYEEALAIGEKRVGHYSDGEMLEIRHPRLSEDRGALETYVSGIYQNKGTYIDGFNQQQYTRKNAETRVRELVLPEDRADFEKTMENAQTYMALRETIKYNFVAQYSQVRKALLRLSTNLGLDSDEIFSLYPHELPQLIDTPNSLKLTINERKQAFNNYPDLDMPSVIREFDIPLIDLKSDGIEHTRELQGRLLARGALIESGVVVKVHDFKDTSEVAKYIRELKERELAAILTARSLTLGHDPLIVATDGVIIENASPVSHGAQRTRELGRGAIGGIIVKHLKTGQLIRFDPENKTVTRVEE